MKELFGLTAELSQSISVKWKFLEGNFPKENLRVNLIWIWLSLGESDGCLREPCCGKRIRPPEKWDIQNNCLMLCPTSHVTSPSFQLTRDNSKETCNFLSFSLKRKQTVEIAICSSLIKQFPKLAHRSNYFCNFSILPLQWQMARGQNKQFTAQHSQRRHAFERHSVSFQRQRKLIAAKRQCWKVDENASRISSCIFLRMKFN